MKKSISELFARNWLTKCRFLMIGAPLKEWLIKTFHRTPKYIGKAADVVMQTNADGVRFDEQGREVVVVAADEVQRMKALLDAAAYENGSDG